MPSRGDLVNMTIDTLKGATGISDNRGSAHSRQGFGSNTNSNDFIIGALGRFDGISWQTSIERNGSGDLLTGDTFDVIVHVGNWQQFEGVAPKEALFQILSRTENWSEDPNVQNGCELQSITVDENYDGTGGDRLLLTFEVTTIGQSLDVAIRFDDGMHTSSVIGFDTNLRYDSTQDPDTDLPGVEPRISEATITITENSSPLGSDYNVEVTPTVFDPLDLVADDHISFYRISGGACAGDHPGMAESIQSTTPQHTFTNIRQFQSGFQVDITLVLTDGYPASDDSNVKDIWNFTVDLDDDPPNSIKYNSEYDNTFGC